MNLFNTKTLKTITINGKPSIVSPVIYDSLVRAEAKMFSTIGKHILINSAYRSTEKQAELYKKLKAKNPAAVVSKPGFSFHEKGQAIDVQNWQEAEPFLKKEGFLNPLTNDKVHFSKGEFIVKETISRTAGLIATFTICFILYKILTKGGM